MISEEQRIDRRQGIGGSDAAAVAGCDPYKSARTLYHEKRGEIPEDDLSDNDAVYWGNVLEDTIAQEYARRTGNKIRRVNRTLVHPDLSFVRAHIDRDVVGTNRALEVKMTGAFMAESWGAPGTDEVPERVHIQCSHYLAVLPKIEVFDVAVLIGGNDFRIYHVPRDNDIIQGLLLIESDFWDRVQKGPPPDFDYDHKDTSALLEKLYPGTDGSVITLPNEAAHWHAVLEECKSLAKKYKAGADVAKDHLKSLCGSSSIAYLPGEDGAYTRKLVSPKGYTVSDPKPYILMSHTKNPKGAS